MTNQLEFYPELFPNAEVLVNEVDTISSFIVALVDDDRIYQFTTERMLHRLNNNIVFLWFKNGVEAMDYIRSHAHNAAELPKILILDINMPLMNGWEFLDEYNQLLDTLVSPIAIYMMSSSIDDRDMKRALSYEYVSDYIEKPITTELLRTLLHRSSLL